MRRNAVKVLCENGCGNNKTEEAGLNKEKVGSRRRKRRMYEQVLVLEES